MDIDTRSTPPLARPSATVKPQADPGPFPVAAPTPGPGKAGTGWRAWLIALVLLAPASIPYLCHYLLTPAELVPTGFISYDMAYYMANTREHFDGGSFLPTYGNPYSHRADTPRIYFQPMTLALALVMRATGADPGAIFIAFGFFAAWCCARVALALYRRVVGLDSAAHWLGLILFAWGGGLLCLAGLTLGPSWGSEGRDPLFFDPGRGYWFLNFGRNLIFPTEALYHAVFFGAILAAITQRFRLALLLAALMSISHPFTGIELLAILWTWAALEVFYLEGRAVPRRFFWAVSGLIGLHLAYYLGILRTSAEHRSLMDQWTLPMVLRAMHAIPAYALVGGLAAWSVRRLRYAQELLSKPANRLFLVWFLVAFGLAKHDLFLTPVQPIHFTRGYIWTALFFLGSGSLIGLLGWLVGARRRLVTLPALGLVLAIGLADNASFLASFPLQTWKTNEHRYITSFHTELYSWMNGAALDNHLILCNDESVNYFAAVYTPLRTWNGHWANTPWRDQRISELQGLFLEGRFLHPWRRQPLVVVFGNHFGEADRPSWLDDQDATLSFENPAFRAYLIPPAPESEPGHPDNRLAASPSPPDRTPR